MVGKMFAGGCVSSFHLTSLARHSVHRLLRRWLEGLDSLRWLHVGLSRPVNPHQVSEPLALRRPVALLLFPTCTDAREEASRRAAAGLRKGRSEAGSRITRPRAKVMAASSSRKRA
jgi:hypothetical protein